MKLSPIQSNMTEITLGNGDRVLFSYQTPVACKLGQEWYRTRHKWSNTTTRHINKWMGKENGIHLDQSFFDNLANGAI